MVLASFCAIRYISSPQYLLGDEKSKERRRSSSRKAAVAINCAASSSEASYRKQEILHLVTLRNFKSEVELLADYGIKYYV